MSARLPALPPRIGVFDTETTGPDPQTARLVTAFIGLMDTATGEVVERWSYAVDPGIPISTGASDIHGITTEKMEWMVLTGRAAKAGEEARAAIFSIVQKLDVLQRQDIPLVIMNAPFDTTLIDREMQRAYPGLRPLFEGFWGVRQGEQGYVEVPRETPGARYVVTRPEIIDPMVLDRAFDKYRAGSRKLVDLAAHYGVPVEANAHDAEADCRMAGRIAIKILQRSGDPRFPKYHPMRGMNLTELHMTQIPTKAKQTGELIDYWLNKKMPKLTTEQEKDDLLRMIESAKKTGHYWPLIPRENA